MSEIRRSERTILFSTHIIEHAERFGALVGGAGLVERVRAKLGSEIIETVRNVGYGFKTTVEEYDTDEEVWTALARPEVSCVAVPPSARHLGVLDLTELTYG